MPAPELTEHTYWTRHLTVNAFVDAYNDMLIPGQTIVYACGDIAASARCSPELTTLKEFAHRYQREGKGYLTQRKVKGSKFSGPGGGCDFEYRFTKAERR